MWSTNLQRLFQNANEWSFIVDNLKTIYMRCIGNSYTFIKIKGILIYLYSWHNIIKCVSTVITYICEFPTLSSVYGDIVHCLPYTCTAFNSLFCDISGITVILFSSSCT